jgi:predicted membrane GTPase involved in stress response
MSLEVTLNYMGEDEVVTPENARLRKWYLDDGKGRGINDGSLLLTTLPGDFRTVL